VSVEALNPSGVAAPLGHLSNATRSGERLTLAGLVALDEGRCRSSAAGSMREQTLHVCRTIEDICRQYGADLTAVARCLIFITDPLALQRDEQRLRRGLRRASARRARRSIAELITRSSSSRSSPTSS